MCGRGGDIIFVADDHLSTLMDFRYKRKYTAPEGGKGGASLCHGKNAENLIIKVPLGTVIKDAESGLVIADLSDHTPVTIAKGGRGGYGNAHFATPTRQIPKFAKPGMPGEDIQVTLELKLIADVGLIGFPNVGKSTLISTISAAKPKIANYHFTTLVPTLGVVSVGEGASFVCADIPGLIEGASEGVGLGHDFLRHVERCRLLLHVVDVSGSECREPVEDFEKINEELAKFRGVSFIRGGFYIRYTTHSRKHARHASAIRKNHHTQKTLPRSAPAGRRTGVHDRPLPGTGRNVRSP